MHEPHLARFKATAAKYGLGELFAPLRRAFREIYEFGLKKGVALGYKYGRMVAEEEIEELKKRRVKDELRHAFERRAIYNTPWPREEEDKVENYHGA